MEYRQLGNSGVRVSVIGMGTNQFGNKVDQAGVNDAIDAALDLGINFIDTANTYQDGRSEETLGEALKGRWGKFVVATKFYFPVGDGPNDRGASRYHMLNAIETSLKRLQNDYIDLYYVHRWDENTPIEETLRALDDLIRMGKVRYVGASAFASWQLARANLLAEVRGWTPFVVLQSHYHMLERQVEQEVLPCCQAHQVGFVPYFPLVGGFLTGKYKRGEPAPEGTRGERSPYVQRYMTDANFDKLDKLREFATSRGHTLHDLAFAWLLSNKHLSSVIAGATKPEQVTSNAATAEWKLSSDEVTEVNEILA